jgi:hypothetical protein
MTTSRRTKGKPRQPVRLVRGRASQGAAFIASPTLAGLPENYGATLAGIKARIGRERLRVVLAANSAMIILYWDIGSTILAQQEKAGWGAKVVDRLAQDLARPSQT